MANVTKKQEQSSKANPATRKTAKALVTLADSYNSELQKTILHNTELKDLAKELESSWGDLSKVLMAINNKSDKLNKNFGFVEDVAKDIVDSMNDIGSELYTQVDISEKIKKIQKEQGKRLSEFKKARKGLNELIQDEKKLEDEKDKLSEYQYDRKLKRLKVERKIKEEALAQLKVDQQSGAFAIQALAGLEETAKAMGIANEHAKKLGFNLENATRTVTGKLEKSFDFMEEIPFLSDVIGLDSIKEKIEKNVKASLVKSMTEGKSAASSLFSAMTTGARTLMTTMGPFLPLIIAAAALYKAFEFDTELTQFSKDMDVSKNAAKELAVNADEIAGSMGVIGVNGKEVMATMGALREEFGVMGGEGSEKLVKNVTFLREKMGLTNDEAIGLNSTASILGTSLEKMTAESMNMGEGLIGSRAMLKEMAKLPKGLVAGFKGTTKELEKAVIKGKLFGLSLEKTKQIGEGMLDIESSIEKEMTANVLTGKHMNLNAARQYALSGQYGKLQDEILQQAGSLSDFTAMGPLQQKATADAMGMTVDEMTGMLSKAEELDKVYGMTGDRAEQLMKTADKNGMIDAKNLKGKELEWAQAQNAAKNQEKATAKYDTAMKSLGEAFQKTMLPIVEILGDALGFLGDIIGYLTHGVEVLNGWFHSLSGSKEELKEGEGVMSSILGWAVKIGAAMLAWNVGKKALGGLKSMIPGMGSGTGDSLDAVTGQADKADKLAEKTKSIGDKIADFGKGIGSFLKDVGKGIGDAIKGLLTGIGEGLSALGKAGVEGFIGVVLLGALGLALWAFKPIVEALTPLIIGLAKVIGDTLVKILATAGPVIKTILEGIGEVIKSIGTSISMVITSIADSIVKLAAIDGGSLIGVAAGIVAIGAALAAFGGGSAIGGLGAALGSLFDEDPVEKFNRFASIDSGKLVEVAGSINALGNAIANFGSQVGKIGEVTGIIDTIDKVMELHDAVEGNALSNAVSGVADAVGGIFSKAASFVTSSAPEASSVTTSSTAATAGGGTAATSQGSLKEVADLLKQLIAATSQPVSINIGGKVIDEIEKQTTLRKTYSTKVDSGYGIFG
jgi:hypothetical protein